MVYPKSRLLSQQMISRLLKNKNKNKKLVTCQMFDPIKRMYLCMKRGGFYMVRMIHTQGIENML